MHIHAHVQFGNSADRNILASTAPFQIRLSRIQRATIGCKLKLKKSATLYNSNALHALQRAPLHVAHDATRRFPAYMTSLDDTTKGQTAVQPREIREINTSTG